MICKLDVKNQEKFNTATQLKYYFLLDAKDILCMDFIYIKL